MRMELNKNRLRTNSSVSDGGFDNHLVPHMSRVHLTLLSLSWSQYLAGMSCGLFILLHPHSIATPFRPSPACSLVAFLKEDTICLAILRIVFE